MLFLLILLIISSSRSLFEISDCDRVHSTPSSQQAHSALLKGEAPACSLSPCKTPPLAAHQDEGERDRSIKNQFTRLMQKSITSISASFSGVDFKGAKASRAISPKCRARCTVSAIAPCLVIRPMAFSSDASSLAPSSIAFFQNARSSSLPRR